MGKRALGKRANPYFAWANSRSAGTSAAGYPLLCPQPHYEFFPAVGQSFTAKTCVNAAALVDTNLARFARFVHKELFLAALARETESKFRSLQQLLGLIFLGHLRNTDGD